jgi:beta-glucosidase
MTLEQKLALVHGARDPRELGQAGYWPGVPRLGIPPLRFADGPGGVNANRTSTAMPAPVALAATFSTPAARRYGVVLGREARALEQNVLLGPHVNLVRDPLFRRNHTTLGEDPLLNARLGAAEIAGIQSQGVLAMVKHLAAYNGPDSVILDERTLHEIYLPAFEAAAAAGVASVMCGYNRVNGAWSCGNAGLDTGVLRGLWGFRGFVTSDWAAVHSPLALTQGVDLEMPGREVAGRGGPYFTGALKSAVESGAVPVAALDQAITRILGQMERFHLLGRKAPARPAAIDVGKDAAVAREIAGQGAVLLRNEGAALPLTAEDLSSLVLIGPTAEQLAVGFMGERGYGFEERLISPLDALRQSAPQARIAYSAGVDLTGVPLPLAAVPPIEPDADYIWQGILPIPEDGDYTFLIQPVLEGGSEGGGTVAIDGRMVARTGGPGFGGTGMVAKKWSSLLPTTDGRDNGRGVVRLTAGPHAIELRANSTGEGALSIRFAWITPEMRRKAIADAIVAARSAYTAIVFAWNGTGATFSLPEDQDELIAGVAAANPRTVVVLNTGGPVAMPWKEQVRAILEMWYPGQEGGWATADLLLGRANPGGKLPVTFPARLEDSPAHAAGQPQSPAPQPSADAAVDFSEGVFAGYRWYDRANIQPLFPFGHGLSFTRFEYSDLFVTPGREGVEVAFTVSNVGSRRGTEVAQVYLGSPDRPPVPMAPLSLAGFERVELAPGGSARIRMRIGVRAFSYWSAGSGKWVVAEGRRPVLAGSSSRDIRLRGSAAWTGIARPDSLQ